MLQDGAPGSRFIANIPGRGYSFVAPIETREEARAEAEEPSVTVPRSPTIPLPLTRIIGRESIVRELVVCFPQRRFITIAGPGGIGKTTVAFAVARAVAASYRDGVVIVDLASVTNPSLVPSVLTSALGVTVQGDDPLPHLVAALDDKQMLILLDSCEHLVDAAASLTEALLSKTRGISVLATSREALRAAGEWVHRLPPLSVPPALASLTAMEALQFPAVQLFVERAAESLGVYDLSDSEAPTVAEICRRLDGIALAIELAAGRMDTFGLRELATQLEDRFRVLTRGRRTALPRHQTMRAALKWSFDLLAESEQLILSRLSILNGAFTLAAACELASGGELVASETPDGVASLVAKSLIAADLSGAEVHYRLLDTTRAYARERLDASGETALLARRHAEYMRALFQRAETEWETRSSSEWLSTYARQVDNLRAALNWAFSADGDTSIGVALSAAAVPLWFQLSLMDECLGWIERALATTGSSPDHGDRRRMQLQAALGWLQMYATTRLERSAAAWTAALKLAQGLGDIDYQLRALWALWADRHNHGEFRHARSLAKRFRNLAAQSDDVSDLLVADRMIGASLHFLGDQPGAETYIEGMLRRYVTPLNRAHTVRFQFDQKITARLFRGRILWLKGYPEQSLRDIEANIADALALGHRLSLGNALAQAACPIALLAGDLDAAQHYVTMLREHSTMHALDAWRIYVACFEGDLLIRRGDCEAGLRLVEAAVNDLRRARFTCYLTTFLMTLATGLLRVGSVSDALARVDEALAICERTGEGWCLAELHRTRGDIILRGSASDKFDEARASLKQSRDIARAQKALSWELRSATSLARLLRDSKWSAEGAATLRSVYAQFTEGFGTQDLIVAASLLKELERG